MWLTCHQVGVIIEVMYDGHRWFCVGEDRKTHELTDFGGGLSKRDVTCIAGAFRVYKHVTKDAIMSAHVVTHERMMILLLTLPLLVNQISTATAMEKSSGFIRRNRSCREIRNLWWIREDKFCEKLAKNVGTTDNVRRARKQVQCCQNCRFCNI
jgi:hypothetical protein